MDFEDDYQCPGPIRSYRIKIKITKVELEDINEPVMKPTDMSLNSSNDVNPNSIRLKNKSSRKND